MSKFPKKSQELDDIESQAAIWVARCDRGLTAFEQDDLSQWLGADPRHREHFALSRREWSRLDQLGHGFPKREMEPDPDLLAPSRSWRFWQLRRYLSVIYPLATAAVLVIAFVIWRPTSEISDPGPAVATPVSDSQRILDDGSVIEVNRGTEVMVHYSEAERRVRIDRGEAHFTVAKDSARPFIVAASGVDVRAIGTAFNVRVDADVVEVLVTQGSVQVEVPPDPVIEPGSLGERRSGAPIVPVLEARQRAVVSLSPNPEPPQVATLTLGEIERVLSWQHRLLNFTAAPLSEIVAEFNRRNTTQLVVIDPELAAVRVSASFRSDNIDGFVHLLKAGFDARVERRGESEIILYKEQ